MAFVYEIEENTAAITGYDGQIAYLQVPAEIGGAPVRCIRQSAFAHRSDLVYVSLPETLRRLERFAFYACPALARVSLCDGIADYHDGVFLQCRALDEFELKLTGGRSKVLRELLADNDRTLRFALQLPDGAARLTFPEYQNEYQEDTRARVIHLHIEGAGFAYRECVSHTGIDFRGYDRLFARIRLLDAALAVQIAADRLCFPWALEPDAEAQYEAFLREHAEFAVRECVRRREQTWLEMLTGRGLLTPEAGEAGIRLASGRDMPDFVAVLMASRRPSAGGRKFKL